MSRREPENGCPWCGNMPEVVAWGRRWTVKHRGEKCPMVIAQFFTYARRIDAVRAWDRRVG